MGTFVAFLKRLSGSAEEDLAVDRRFQKRLEDADDKNEELDKLKGDLQEVTSVVSKRQKEIVAATLAPGTVLVPKELRSQDTGEHRLHLDEDDGDRRSGSPRERQDSAGS